MGFSVFYQTSSRVRRFASHFFWEKIILVQVRIHFFIVVDQDG